MKKEAMTEHFKLEIYCSTREDMDMLINLVERFAMFAPEYKFRPALEFGKIRVEHHHFDLIKLPAKEQEKRIRSVTED